MSFKAPSPRLDLKYTKNGDGDDDEDNGDEDDGDPSPTQQLVIISAVSPSRRGASAVCCLSG